MCGLQAQSPLAFQDSGPAAAWAGPEMLLSPRGTTALAGQERGRGCYPDSLGGSAHPTMKVPSGLSPWMTLPTTHPAL